MLKYIIVVIVLQKMSHFYQAPSYDQYMNAYPQLPDAPPPSAANGYGWAGHGFGWQLDPSAWQKPSLYPKLDEVVEEPEICAKKVEVQEVSNRLYFCFSTSGMVLWSNK